jgi:hypothetical protein
MISRLENIKRRPLEVVTVAVLVLFLTNDVHARKVNDSVLYIPLVVKIDKFIDTAITVSNPGPQAVQIEVIGYPSYPFFDPLVVQLAPGAARNIEVKGASPVIGWLSIRSNQPIYAVANIRDLLNGRNITLRAEPAAAKMVLPVFRKLTGAAEETVISIVFGQAGEISLTLIDSQGKAIAVRKLLKPDCDPTNRSSHLVKGVSDLFPQLPDAFTSGSLTIEYPSMPEAFAAVAFYVSGSQMWSSPGNRVDTPVTYLVAMPGGTAPAAEMARQYGFTIEYVYDVLPGLAIVAIPDVARAVSRDPRVSFVELNSVGCVDFKRE